MFIFDPSFRYNLIFGIIYNFRYKIKHNINPAGGAVWHTSTLYESLKALLNARAGLHDPRAGLAK